MSGKRLIKTTKLKTRSKKMSETEIKADTSSAGDIETIKAKQSGSGILRIDRSMDGQTISIFIQHPLLADIVRKMAVGNAPTNAYNAIYKPILVTIPGHPERVVTRPAVGKITKNFVQGGEFTWEAPTGILVYNADALEAGYTLTYKVEAPFAPETARRWGKMFMDGCNDIIANARPFQMTWVMKEKATTSQTPAVLPVAELLKAEPTF